jgi:NitT/TauT family transport system substrate-binding protein
VINTKWAERRIGFQPYPFPSYTAALVTELRKTQVVGDNSFLSKINLKTVHNDIVAVGLAEAAIKKNGGNAAFGLPAKLTRTEVIKP